MSGSGVAVQARFFRALGPATLAHLCEVSGAQLTDQARGADPIESLAPAYACRPGALSFVSSAKAFKALSGPPGGLIVSPELFDAVGLKALSATAAAVLIADDPVLAFAICADVLHAVRPPDDLSQDLGLSRVHPSAHLARGVVIAAGVKIGPRARIDPNAVIGPGVTIGEGTVVGPCAVVVCADIGADCEIGAGAVIGQTGFGVAAPGGPRARMAPQLGQVRIEDRVVLGSNSTIDRAAFGATQIGADTKIDNLVQIGHNARIGRGCVLAGAVGVAGSASLGDGVMVGGGVGIADHVTIGAGARIAGGSALVNKDIPAGETWSGGVPAKRLRVFYRELAVLAKLGRGE